MPNFKVVSQKRWVKLLNAATGILSQQGSALTRISNLLGTQRGSLQTCDGSALIGTLTSPYTFPLALGVYNSYQSGLFPFYVVIALNPNPTIPEFSPAPTFAVSGGSGGSPTIFHFALVAWDITGTLHNTPVIAAIHGNTGNTTITVNFTLPPGSDHVVLYSLSTALPTYVWHSTATSSTTPISGTIGSGSTVSPITGNNSFQSQLEVGSIAAGATLVGFNIGSGSTYSGPNILPAPLTPGDPQFNSNSPFPGFTPYGGISGIIETVPEVLQFTNLAILILGNGVAPQSVDPTSATPTPANLTNTFQATYPPWQASVNWGQGSQIGVLVGGNTYLFTAIQGGVSGASSPTFPTALDATVADNQVIWQNGGKVSTTPAPRGAAHGIVYAGSLWLANTSPTTTTDGLDGPTVIKMSDSNNPSSWNPLNVAFIGRDDGTQITGLASFTIAEVGIAPTGSLTVFKEFSTYQIIGVFGSSDFQIALAQTDMGCIAARTIQFIPGFGICRLSHLGFAVFDGVRDRLISEEIRPYLFGGIDSDADITPIDWQFAYFSKGTQITQPPIYLAACPLMGNEGDLTRVFCYDLVLKSWTIIDLPWDISTLNQARTGDGRPLTLAGLADGTGRFERLQSGDVQWNANELSPSVINWSFQSSDVFAEGSSARVFYRRVTIRGYAISIPQNGSPGIAQAINMTVTATIDGNPSVVYQGQVTPQPFSNQFELQIDILQTAQVVHLAIAGSGQCVIDSLDWQLVQRPGGQIVLG